MPYPLGPSMKETLGKPSRSPFAFFPGTFPAFVLSWALVACTLGHRGRGGNVPPATAITSAPVISTVAADRSPVTNTLPTPKEHRVGTVRVIGDGQRFVLVEVPPSGAGPLPDGLMLHCSASPNADATANATLRISTERRRPYIVADVVDGEPHVGDAVFAARPTANRTASGPTVLPTATSGVLPIVIPGGTSPTHHP